MLLSSVKKSIERNMAGSFKLPDDNVLQEKIYEALLYVATSCEPSALLRKKHVDDDASYRELSGGFYVAFPEYPDFTYESRHLNIDEALSYAVINYVCFMLSNKVEFDTLCSRWLSLYRQNELNAYAGDVIDED